MSGNPSQTGRVFPVVAGYEMLTELGRGGFGTVYRARQLSVDREVAIKVVSAQLGSDTERRFRSECHTIGQLSWHPHIVPLYDAGITAEGTPFLVMELMTGGSLADRLKGGAVLGPLEVVGAGAQIAEALGEAHEAGVVHRDVKPANCLVDRRGIIRLGDFGIAVLQDQSLTTTTGFVGTLAYTAPEVLRGGRATPRSDVYSLGATLYELAAGRAPFSGETPDDSPAALMWRIANEPRSPLPSTIPPHLTEILDQAMAKEAEMRQPSAQHLRSQLATVEREMLNEQDTAATVAVTDGATVAEASGGLEGISGDDGRTSVVVDSHAPAGAQGPEPALPEHAEEKHSPDSYLEVRGRDLSNDVVLAGEEVTVGRSPDNVVSVPMDKTMSSKHVVLFRRADGWWLRDTGSANGTRVNGTRLTAEHLLHADDQVVLGETRLTLRAGVPVDQNQADVASGPDMAPAPDDHPSAPSSRSPVLRPRRGRGHVRGFARSIQTRSTPDGRVVLSFRVDSYDESGARLDAVAVELPDYTSGRLGDGEEVDVTGRWKHGTLRARTVVDLSTQSQVRGRTRSGKLGCLVTLLIIVLLLASALKVALVINGGWDKDQGHDTESCPAPAHLKFFC